MAQQVPFPERPYLDLPMNGDENREKDAKLAPLVGAILADFQKLARQEMALAKVELKEEWAKTKLVARNFAVATAVGTVGVFLAGVAVALLLAELGLALWLAFAFTALFFGGAAYALVSQAQGEIPKIDFVPRQTVQTVKENIRWIRNRT